MVRQFTPDASNLAERKIQERPSIVNNRNVIHTHNFVIRFNLPRPRPPQAGAAIVNILQSNIVVDEEIVIKEL